MHFLEIAELSSALDVEIYPWISEAEGPWYMPNLIPKHAKQVDGPSNFDGSR